MHQQFIEFHISYIKNLTNSMPNYLIPNYHSLIYLQKTELSLHGIVEIEIGLMRKKAMPVVRFGDRIPRPIAGFVVGEDDARVAIAIGGVTPDVKIALGAAGRRPPRPLKPRMLVGGVVDN